MSPVKLHLIVAAAAAWSGSVALAESAAPVYGTTARAGRSAFLPENRPLFVAAHGPSAGVFGAVAEAAALRVENPGAIRLIVDEGPAVEAAAPARDERRGRGESANVRASASVVLDLADTMHAITASSSSARTLLLHNLNARLGASRQAMAELSLRARVLRGNARAAFEVAARDVRTSERALQRSLKTAKKAADDSWITARAELAAHYHAYAEAVAHAEAVASVSVPGPPVATGSGHESPSVG